MTLGKAYHQAIQHFIVGRPKDALEAYEFFWSSSREEIEALPDLPKAEEQGVKRASMFDLAKKVSEHYQGQFAPMDVEYYFEIGIDDFTVTGYIDMITEGGEVIDWKTGTKPQAENAALFSKQLTVYDMAYRAKHGTKPIRIGLLWAGMRKKGPKIVASWDGPRSDARIERIKNSFRVLHQAVLNDGPWAGAPDAAGVWWCSKLKCPYHSECPVRP